MSFDYRPILQHHIPLSESITLDSIEKSLRKSTGISYSISRDKMLVRRYEYLELYKSSFISIFIFLIPEQGLISISSGISNAFLKFLFSRSISRIFVRLFTQTKRKEFVAHVISAIAIRHPKLRVDLGIARQIPFKSLQNYFSRV